MEIDKAIELLNNLSLPLKTAEDHDNHDAVRMGMLALRFVSRIPGVRWTGLELAVAAEKPRPHDVSPPGLDFALTLIRQEFLTDLDRLGLFRNMRVGCDRLVRELRDVVQEIHHRRGGPNTERVIQESIELGAASVKMILSVRGGMKE